MEIKPHILEALLKIKNILENLIGCPRNAHTFHSTKSEIYSVLLNFYERYGSSDFEELCCRAGIIQVKPVSDSDSNADLLDGKFYYQINRYTLLQHI